MRGPTQRHPAARPQPWGEGQPPASTGSTGGPLQSSRLRSPGRPLPCEPHSNAVCFELGLGMLTWMARGVVGSGPS